MVSIANVAAIENRGRYIIRNVKGNTVLDLNGSDGRTSKSPRTLPRTSSPSDRAFNLVIGYTYHGGENQQWETIHINGSNWHIKSVGTDKYLSLEHPPADDVRLVAAQEPFVWDLWDDDKVANAIRYGSTHCWMTILAN